MAPLNTDFTDSRFTSDTFRYSSIQGSWPTSNPMRWRVRAIVNGNNGPWSNVRHIVTSQSTSNDYVVALYPFNGNANDESGNEFHGNSYGASLTTDRFGNPNSAYEFDGDDDYIGVNSNSQLELTNEMSIAAWIRFISGGGQNPRIISIGGKYGQHAKGYELMTEGNGSERSFRFDFGNKVLLSRDIKYNSNNWYFVVGVGNSTSLKLYVDGQLIAELNEGPSEFDFSNTTLDIGRKAIQYFDEWKGIIDDLTIYDKSLNANEVYDLYITTK